MRLSFDHLTCAYQRGQAVLEGVTFDLGRGLWLVLGPNGAGKSTLLRCAAGLLPPRRGRLLWDGADAYRLAGRFRWHIGYAPQELGGYPELSVRSYLAYLGALKGIRAGRLAGRVERVLEAVSLAGEAERPIAELAGGMKSRLGLAQALLNDPDLLLLDEPTAGLDPEERVRFRQLMLDLAFDRIVLVATNVPSDVEGMADGCIRLTGGRLASFAD
ncbi:MAG: ATP-binding cassette domain-containing protein [Mycobacterium leprae]